jgi:formimidoylglutamate deiminase
VTLGVVAHSLRAATPDEVAAIHREAKRRGWVLHIHVEEQRREIEECREAYGDTPMAVLLDHLGDAAGVTAVHSTHTRPRDLERFLGLGGRLCVCPLTEANLGDGLPDLGGVKSPGAICLGTDSNARISMLEEARWLEYGQRLRRERRGALTDGSGRVAPRLLAAATSAGAVALGVDAGRIAPGAWADLIAVDLAHPSLEGWEDTTLLESLVFGTDDRVIVDSWVGGV